MVLLRKSIPQNRNLKAAAELNVRIGIMKKIFGLVAIALGIIAILIIISEIYKSGAFHAIYILQSIVAAIFILQGLSYFHKEKVKFSSSQSQVDPHGHYSGPYFLEEKRLALVNKLKLMKEPLIIPIREFLDGNINDFGSIGCNIYPKHPGIEAFREKFNALLSRADVSEIYAHIREIEPDSESWPYTDTVYVVGTVSIKDVETETKHIEPTEVSLSSEKFTVSGKSIELKKDQKILTLWWD